MGKLSGLHVLHLKAIVLLTALGGRGRLGRLTFLMFNPGIINRSTEDDPNRGCSSANAPDQPRRRLARINEDSRSDNVLEEPHPEH